jgi:hypothetical protein
MSSHVTSRQPGIGSWFSVHVPTVHEKLWANTSASAIVNVLEEIYD